MLILPVRGDNTAIITSCLKVIIRRLITIRYEDIPVIYIKLLCYLIKVQKGEKNKSQTGGKKMTKLISLNMVIIGAQEV